MVIPFAIYTVYLLYTHYYEIGLYILFTRFKPKTKKSGIYSFIVEEIVKRPPFVAGNSLTRRPKGRFAVYWTK